MVHDLERIAAWFLAVPDGPTRAVWGTERGRRLLTSQVTEVMYVGRRSGRTISTLVMYMRHADEITIRVALPDSKTWWRNFTGDGGPITLVLDGAQRTGHAVAHRQSPRTALVAVTLDAG